MTLSLFPTLLSWSQISPLLIRLTLGVILIFWTYQSFRQHKALPARLKALSVLEGIAAILFVLGLWTQAAALFIIIDLIVRLAMKVRSRTFFTDGVNYYFILLVLALSLLVTGAGLFAFDLAL